MKREDRKPLYEGTPSPQAGVPPYNDVFHVIFNFFKKIDFENIILCIWVMDEVHPSFRSLSYKRLARKAPSRRRRRPFSSRKMYNIAKTAVRRMAETKFHETSQLAQNVDYSGSLWDLTNMAQSATDTTRNGDQVTVKTLQMRASYTFGTSPNEMRLIVFQWLVDDNVDAPIATDILSSVGSALATLAPFQHDNASNYRVLYDTGPLSTDTYNTHKVFRKIYLPLYKMKKCVKKVKFDGGSTYGTNHLYLLAISNDGAATYPTLNFWAKFNYIDN